MSRADVPNPRAAGSDTGGERAAAIYTIVQTAKLNDLNPETYLLNTLAKIAEGHPISRIRQLDPDTRISTLSKRLAIAHAPTVAKFAEGLRLVGMPE
jgi:transposase IS66-like protein